MSEAAIKYRRLPGRGRRGGIMMTARCSLWLAPDHLLAVDTVWVNEEYKRFYLRDIQAITIEQTRTALLWNCVLGVVAVCMGALFYAFSESAGPGGGRVGFLVTGGVISGVCLLFLIISYLRGPSCICRVRTAVQTEVLPSLGRTHAAQRTLDIVKPLIEQAQGTLSPGQLPTPATAETAPKPATAPRPAIPTPATVVQHRSNGRIHAVLFSLLELDALVGFVSHLYPGWRLYSTCSALLLLGITGMSITALVKQREALLSDGVKSLTVATFAWNMVVLCAIFIYGFIARLMYAMTHPGRLPTHINFYALGWFKQLSLVSDVVEIAFGATGMVLIYLHMTSQSRAAEPEPPQPIA
jgi:hypothetical protein